jgi:hypothetical protein
LSDSSNRGHAKFDVDLKGPVEGVRYVSELRDHQRIKFAQGFLGAKICSPLSDINDKFIK